MEIQSDVDISKSQVIKNIFNGNYEIAYIYMQLLPKDEIYPIFRYLEQNMPEFYSIVRTSWCLRCFITNNSDIQPPFSQNLFISDLVSLKLPIFQDIKPIISANFNQEQIKNLDLNFSLQ